MPRWWPLHDRRSGTDLCSEAFVAWQFANERVEAAAAEVVLRRTVAGQVRVVAS